MTCKYQRWGIPQHTLLQKFLTTTINHNLKSHIPCLIHELAEDLVTRLNCSRVSFSCLFTPFCTYWMDGSFSLTGIPLPFLPRAAVSSLRDRSDWSLFRYLAIGVDTLAPRLWWLVGSAAGFGSVVHEYLVLLLSVCCNNAQAPVNGYELLVPEDHL